MIRYLMVLYVAMGSRNLEKNVTVDLWMTAAILAVIQQPALWYLELSVELENAATTGHVVFNTQTTFAGWLMENVISQNPVMAPLPSVHQMYTR